MSISFNNTPRTVLFGTTLSTNNRQQNLKFGMKDLIGNLSPRAEKEELEIQKNPFGKIFLSVVTRLLKFELENASAADCRKILLESIADNDFMKPRYLWHKLESIREFYQRQKDQGVLS